MAEYQLEATEGGGIYSIPQGETMIGRGPFLGIADKKVSRNHAILEVVDGKLRIKPIHVNPCFYQASHKGTFVPLEKDEWCLLHDGDCISLLPDKYSFRVIAQDATLR
ncbi:PREDICTED: aprataxin and PNK-like factor [Nanorana parkeri]|uniref:aprataxin and PNK-like factor n=1 Tax=Nanorana parkeri TaxID=125878 RepID=UPI000854236C|nr:PREDICTED: aprataxin and PNK-like factor [Nanorana parkeri]